ncbi:hypothetical protein ATDW_23900 [Asticcacaulis sp. DW145]|uniref:hypothetical protein n=1 Tax=Asticcacaulis sp. DW145 TaxID=3095608 RepID=UPI003090D029|nr:hypothetical protein ATDW_23900 [Asticcacaulis sp. DW145]
MSLIDRRTALTGMVALPLMAAQAFAAAPAGNNAGAGFRPLSAADKVKEASKLGFTTTRTLGQTVIITPSAPYPSPAVDFEMYGQLTERGFVLSNDQRFDYPGFSDSFIGGQRVLLEKFQTFTVNITPSALKPILLTLHVSSEPRTAAGASSTAEITLISRDSSGFLGETTAPFPALCSDHIVSFVTTPTNLRTPVSVSGLITKSNNERTLISAIEITPLL